jgi:hypothetical protein
VLGVAKVVAKVVVVVKVGVAKVVVKVMKAAEVAAKEVTAATEFPRVSTRWEAHRQDRYWVLRLPKNYRVNNSYPCLVYNRSF